MKKSSPLAVAILFLFLMAPPAGQAAEEITVETDNFSLLGELPEEKLEEWGSLLEERRREIADQLSFYYLGNWEKRCQVRFTASPKEFTVKSGAPGWAKGWSRVEYKKKKEGVEIKGRMIWVRSDFPGSEMEPLFSHEIAHLLYREFLEFPEGVPLWLDEGVAVWAEARNRPQYERTIRMAIEKEAFYPLTDFFNLREYPKDKTLFYAQASSIIQFLVSEYGAHEFQRFSRLIRDGVSMSESMEKVYQANVAEPEEFETRWKEWVAAQE